MNKKSAKITSAIFLRGIVDADPTLEDGTPHVAFIGRSNVGKSSLINSLTGVSGLARTSSQPGRTQEIIIFHVNRKFYFVDLPGYGYAKTPKKKMEWFQKLLGWYLFDSGYNQKIVFIIDAEVGLTANDQMMLQKLEEHEKDFIVVANKIDKIRKSGQVAQLAKLQAIVGVHTIIPYSSKKRIGKDELLRAILG